jgi:hypothetical protein
VIFCRERIIFMETEAIEKQEEPRDNSWKVQTLVIGGIVGALTGLGAAYLLTRRAEQNGAPLSITPTKGIQLGVLLAGVVRSILNLGEE